jgi:ketosteroid isomerase-like protein
MSQEKVEVVHRLIEAWNTGGLDEMLRRLPEDVVWFPFPEWPDGAEARHGHEGVRELMEAWTDNFDEYTTDAQEIRDLGDRVLVLGEIAGRIKGSGVPIRQPLGYVLSDFRTGQFGEAFGEAHFFLTWTDALEAAGLSE